MSHKLLLADDSVTIQRVVELTFAGEDVEVLTVGDGEQAIARVRADRPDIVLADIGMPKRSGYDVSAFIKKDASLSHIPVLLLTGAFEPVDEDRVRDAGCDGVLIKPFEPQQVIERVRELLGGAPGSPMKATSEVGRPIDRLSTSRAVPAPPGDTSPALPPPASAPPLRLVATPPKAASGSAPADPKQVATSKALEDYFDQLDAAFAARAAGLEVPAPKPLEPEPADVPPEVSQMPPAPAPPAPSPVPDPVAAVPVRVEEAPAVVKEPPRWQGPERRRMLRPVEPPRPVVPEAFEIVPVPDEPAAQDEPAPPVAQVVPAEAPASAPPEAGTIAHAFSALLAVEQGEPGARPVRLTVAPSEPVIDSQLIEKIVQQVIERLAPGTVKDVVSDVVSDVAERMVRDEIARIRKKTP